MKNYSDLQDIDTRLHCVLQLEPIGNPEVSVIIKDTFGGGKLFQPVTIETHLPLLESFFVTIELRNKIYDQTTETAVVIKSLRIDGIEIVPRFDHLASYVNDHNNQDPSHYLGFNGKWTLTIDRPFYHWLHEHTGQGWLLS